LSITVNGNERNGYNTFLTAVCIFIADTITKRTVLYSLTKVVTRKRILSEYKHDKKQFGNTTEEEEEEEFFVGINEYNIQKANKIIDKWIDNNCQKKAKSGGKKHDATNKKRKSKKRKSKKCKSKRL
jgi:hypothetical protein